MKAIQSVGFCLVTSAALVPSPLIEPRYYIMPFILARLHLVSDRRTGLELAWYALLNGVTLWLFLTRPFRWPQDPHQWQRFMW
jgi:alpha-1,2-glucosyltransferase